MEEEQYCLKWNNHQSTLLTVLTGLMDTERLADCILSAEGKMLKAHQVIISACSPYLEKLLNESRQPGYMPILIFSDLVFDELVAMKEYMYKGEVNIRQDALDSFLKAACNLQIKGLADGGGGGDEGGGGGGGKRKAPPEIVDSSPARAGRRRRRESRESDHTQDMIPQEPQLPQPVPAKKQNVFTAKVEPFEPAPVVKMEPIMDQPPMPQPQIQHAPQLVMKPEPQDHHEPETHDLTGLDDDEDYDYDMPGTSQPDLSQDISNWQMDNSMHSAEDFAASQSMNTSQPGQSSQGNVICTIDTDSTSISEDSSSSSSPSHIETSYEDESDNSSDQSSCSVVENGCSNGTAEIALTNPSALQRRRINTNEQLVFENLPSFNGTYNNKYFCDRCNESFPSETTLLHHTQQKCNCGKTFSCDICPFFSHNMDSLKLHILKRHL